MPRTVAPRFRKHLIALAASAALAPCSTWALDLSESPPGTVEPYVRPNVIISVDDSGSMDWQVTNTSAGTASIIKPNVDGSWDTKAKRINILKHSLKQVFSDTTLLPDKKIRLSWQTMWNNGTSPDAKNVNSTSMQQNSMRVLESTHRTNFFNFVDSLKAVGNTPSHWMFSQADAYMRQPLGPNSVWASNPGTGSGAPFLGCRRNYHIFMSDGRWNSTATGGQKDNATKGTLPDGMVYGGDTAADQKKTALYRDGHSNTLADWAFYSWSTPLQTSGLSGTLKPSAEYFSAPATENFNNDPAGTPAILEKYWNPRYNPATWPHMVTYTIGFSTDAITWPGAIDIVAPTQQVPFGYDKSFLSLVNGSQTWPAMDNENKRALDLWHAALNGRGRFYAVKEGKDLEKAFREIVGQINTATDTDLNSSTTSGSNVSRSDVGKYTAAYEPINAWKGFLVADKVKPDGSIISEPGWGGKNTADKLDAIFSVGSRLVLSWSDTWDSTQYKGGVSFKWDAGATDLSTGQKLWLQTAFGVDQGAAKGEQRLNYIRGDRSLEGVESAGYTASKPYRERKSRQGDIINSDVWYTGAPAGNSLLKGYADFVRDNKTRPAMLYVGGNDGMLHGFAAKDGEEKIAYIPRGTIPNLALLTDPLYNTQHKYFVDGSPMTGDMDNNGGMQDPKATGFATYTPDWRTLLVGTLGLGGKGYFVLDVTHPTAAGFTEGNAKNLVKLDRTRGGTEPAPDCSKVTMTSDEKIVCAVTIEEDKDMGFITARPVRHDNDAMRSTQITRMNDNRWAVVLGNGYNSANQRPVLLVQYLDGDKKLLRLPVTAEAPGVGNANDNGLAAPRLVDLNGDGNTDVVYAGDNLGNVWKFDLTHEDSSNWKVAFGGQPLFTAGNPMTIPAKIQPISTVPSVRANDRMKDIDPSTTAETLVRVGGMMVAFGTGRNIDKNDPASTDVQTLYSVLDNTRYQNDSTATKGKRLKVHPGGGACPSGADCVPVPTPLGHGVAAAKLAKQKFTAVGASGYAKIDVVDALKKDTWVNFNGWYLDLPDTGERLLKPMEFYDSSNLLAVWTQVPAKSSSVDANAESCEVTTVAGEKQYRTFVNIMDGKKPSVKILDTNKDGFYTPTDEDASRAQVASGPHTLITKKQVNLDMDAKNKTENLARMPEKSLRPNWRQMR